MKGKRLMQFHKKLYFYGQTSRTFLLEQNRSAREWVLRKSVPVMASSDLVLKAKTALLAESNIVIY